MIDSMYQIGTNNKESHNCSKSYPWNKTVQGNFLDKSN